MNKPVITFYTEVAGTIHTIRLGRRAGPWLVRACVRAEWWLVPGVAALPAWACVMTRASPRPRPMHVGENRERVHRAVTENVASELSAGVSGL